MILVGGSPPLGEPPPGEKNQLLQFEPKRPQNLIPSALCICDPRIKVWEQSDQCLLKGNVFPEGEASPPPGEPPPGEKNQLLQFEPKRPQNLIPSALCICDPRIKVWEQSDQCLLKRNVFPEGEASPPPGEPPPGEKNQLL
jgi:hypothetical protein